MKTDIIIHIGLHKTATSFLQQEIFPKLDVDFYCQPRSREFLGIKTKQKKILISNEALSGKPHLNPIDSNERIRIANSLHLLFPNARIIVGIRNKEDWYNSLFKQYSKASATYNKQTFNNMFDKGYLDFDSYTNHLKSLFPSVYVYHFEMLKEDPKKFVDGICKFIGEPTPDFTNKVVNKAMTKGQLELFSALHNIEVKCYRKIRKILECQREDFLRKR
jgi:hypothetical protein